MSLPPEPPAHAPSPKPGDAAALEGVLAFVRSAEALKNTLRSGHTSTGRPESTAEHSWRLSLLALCVVPQLPGIDLARLLSICVLHDLAEAVHGDIPAVLQHQHPQRQELERQALAQLLQPLDSALSGHFSGLVAEYEAGQTPEAQAAKALDKLETLLQHTQGANPPGFDYAFNLDYGRRYTDAIPALAALRQAIDEATRQRLQAPQTE